MTYRAGIIGCGFAGVTSPDSHLEAYQKCPDTEVVVLCDKDEWKADRFLDTEEIELTTSSYWDMIRISHPDIVSVCTPIETHCKIVCDIAPYVKAIYCEKPIALTLEDADKMIDVCHKYEVILQVNHQRRFMPVKARFSRDIINTGTHMFDRLRQLFGEAEFYEYPYIKFGAQLVEIEYIDTKEHIFEIDCTRNSERMTLKGVEHLVSCLKNHKRSISNGEEARKSLEVTLAFKKLNENI